MEAEHDERWTPLEILKDDMDSIMYLVLMRKSELDALHVCEEKVAETFAEMDEQLKKLKDDELYEAWRDGVVQLKKDYEQKRYC